jgi:hypothetical protein
MEENDAGHDRGAYTAASLAPWVHLLRFATSTSRSRDAARASLRPPPGTHWIPEADPVDLAAVTTEFGERSQDISRDGASRTRTGDLLGAIQALSQLSYSPEMPRACGEGKDSRDCMASGDGLAESI